jgi:hypothetical protein
MVVHRFSFLSRCFNTIHWLVHGPTLEQLQTLQPPLGGTPVVTPSNALDSDSPIPLPTMAHLKGPFKASLPDKVRVTLDQPFGKDNLNQSFTADCRLRHVLLHLFKSEFLDARDQACLELAYRPAYVLRHLMTDHVDVDFSPLRGYQADWDASSDIDEHRVRMITAAFLHFDCCAATVVRNIGGPHTAAHRDPDQILATLRDSVDPAIYLWSGSSSSARQRSSTPIPLRQISKPSANTATIVQPMKFRSPAHARPC